jgi:hypothetical protein
VDASRRPAAQGSSRAPDGALARHSAGRPGGRRSSGKENANTRQDDQRQLDKEVTERLRTLWDKNLPANEIGRRLGISKNAVLGKAWRLALLRRRPPDTPTPAPEIIPPGPHHCRRPYCEAHCRCAYVRHRERNRQ